MQINKCRTFNLSKPTMKEQVNMRTIMKKLAGNRSGATAIEYGLIAGLVAVAIVASVTLVGGNLNTLFGTVNTDLTAAA
jgi:pilus assembly protein Flp/PilA